MNIVRNRPLWTDDAIADADDLRPLRQRVTDNIPPWSGFLTPTAPLNSLPNWMVV
ncbi:MAG TPA: hypothetical protein VFC19_01555 [Candidatus Limnocylindrales bacterium]|nr:hypothetical protein [Candidatus Limnocylindrales bacterium]